MPLTLRDHILSRFPRFLDLRFYAALDAGGLSFDQTMKAHLQDVARSVGCRGLREIQLECLDNAVMDSEVHASDAGQLAEVIEDEVPKDGRPSHFAIRVQMFEGLGYSTEQLERVRPLTQTAGATRIFRGVFSSRDLLAMTAAVGAIEQWYVPVAARLEKLYLDIGYSESQVATYTLHKSADLFHSEIALAFVDKYADPSDWSRILAAVETGFQSVHLYDEGRYAAAADDTTLFPDYLHLS